MKLGELKAAIRKMKGAPKTGGIYHPEGGDVELLDLEVTKQSLLAAIDRAFPDANRGTETGMRLRQDGHIGIEGNDDDAPPPAEDDDLSNVLG